MPLNASYFLQALNKKDRAVQKFLDRARRLENALWWKFMPGVEFKVKWPCGWVVLDDDGQGGQTSTESADPNDHYRPEMETLIGRQGWDWQWDLRDSDISENKLTIKVRNKHKETAMMLALRWS